jgi:hypothetical protein
LFFTLNCIVVKTNKWDKSYENSVLNTFSKLRYELTLVPVNDSEILLHDNRIVIPKDLQMRVIDLAHEAPFHVIAVLSLLFSDDPHVQGQLHAFVNPLV